MPRRARIASPSPSHRCRMGTPLSLRPNADSPPPTTAKPIGSKQSDARADDADALRAELHLAQRAAEERGAALEMERQQRAHAEARQAGVGLRRAHLRWRRK